jgi:hypothetical protein
LVAGSRSLPSIRTTPPGCCASTPRRSRPRRTWTASGCCAAQTPPAVAEDIALGYKQLIEVERGWRDLKTHLELRPVYHRAEHRIRAHVLLCWLALLLVRLAETDRTRTWRRIREQLQTLHLGEFTDNAGTMHQRTEVTADQRDILSRLELPEPPRFLHLDVATG